MRAIEKLRWRWGDMIRKATFFLSCLVMEVNLELIFNIQFKLNQMVSQVH